MEKLNLLFPGSEGIIFPHIQIYCSVFHPMTVKRGDVDIGVLHDDIIKPIIPERSTRVFSQQNDCWVVLKPSEMQILGVGYPRLFVKAIDQITDSYRARFIPRRQTDVEKQIEQQAHIQAIHHLYFEETLNLGNHPVRPVNVDSIMQAYRQAFFTLLSQRTIRSLHSRI